MHGIALHAGVLQELKQYRVAPVTGAHVACVFVHIDWHVVCFVKQKVVATALGLDSSSTQRATAAEGLQRLTPSVKIWFHCLPASPAKGAAHPLVGVTSERRAG